MSLENLAKTALINLAQFCGGEGVVLFQERSGGSPIPHTENFDKFFVSFLIFFKIKSE